MQKFRGLCLNCLHPPLTCYCEQIQSFDPKIRFIILIHGREAQKRIATGRISHLCLQNSELLSGYDYSENSRVNTLIADKNNFCMVLYPGPHAINLSQQTLEQRSLLIPKNKELILFVIDGTWITARKTMQRSSNLNQLPQICFQPTKESRFRVRKQPQPNFYSTVEAIHQTIELLGPATGFDIESRSHDGLLHVFDHMVEQQLELSKQEKIFCKWKPKKESCFSH